PQLGFHRGKSFALLTNTSHYLSYNINNCSYFVLSWPHLVQLLAQEISILCHLHHQDIFFTDPIILSS
ncbi:hypothetical protein, partial [Wolbachia pipientis]|uniref:hypothetical protein n=1 Tax=Wolbachia pipientis TaxID=955 RepID=UPI001C3F7D87